MGQPGEGGLGKMKIYCAGPLFNRKEKEEMEESSSLTKRYEEKIQKREKFNLKELMKNGILG